MKFNHIKRISLALALLILLTAMLSSCGVKPVKSTDEEAAIVGTIGKFEVRYEELRYLVRAIGPIVMMAIVLFAVQTSANMVRPAIALSAPRRPETRRVMA